MDLDFCLWFSLNEFKQTFSNNWIWFYKSSHRWQIFTLDTDYLTNSIQRLSLNPLQYDIQIYLLHASLIPSIIAKFNQMQIAI